MKTNQNKTTTTSQISVRLVAVLVLLLLSNLNVFGQHSSAVVAAPVVAFQMVAADDTVATVTNTTTTNDTMNFVSWFMGTKQTTNANSAADVSGSSKKQMINAGIAPNRLLLKAFLKKASNYASTVA